MVIFNHALFFKWPAPVKALLPEPGPAYNESPIAENNTTGHANYPARLKKTNDAPVFLRAFSATPKIFG